jgi:hypothetical protein
MLLLGLVSFMMQKIPGQQVIRTDDTPTMFFDRNRCKQGDSGHTSAAKRRPMWCLTSRSVDVVMVRWQCSAAGPGFCMRIDNNVSERDVRRIAIGRKNWQFIGSEAAGYRIAALYSILSICSCIASRSLAGLPAGSGSSAKAVVARVKNQRDRRAPRRRPGRQ